MATQCLLPRVLIRSPFAFQVTAVQAEAQDAEERRDAPASREAAPTKTGPAVDRPPKPREEKTSAMDGGTKTVWTRYLHISTPSRRFFFSAVLLPSITLASLRGRGYEQKSKRREGFWGQAPRSTARSPLEVPVTEDRPRSAARSLLEVPAHVTVSARAHSSFFS